MADYIITQPEENSKLFQYYKHYDIKIIDGKKYKLIMLDDFKKDLINTKKMIVYERTLTDLIKLEDSNKIKSEFKKSLDVN